MDEVPHLPSVPSTQCFPSGQSSASVPALSIHLENNTLRVKCFRARQSDGSFKGFFPLGSMLHEILIKAVCSLLSLCKYSC